MLTTFTPHAAAICIAAMSCYKHFEMIWALIFRLFKTRELLCSHGPCSAFVRPPFICSTRIIRLCLRPCQLYLLLLFSNFPSLSMQSMPNIPYMTCRFLNCDCQRDVRCKSCRSIIFKRNLPNKRIPIRSWGQWLSGCSLESCWCKLVRRLLKI